MRSDDCCGEDALVSLSSDAGERALTAPPHALPTCSAGMRCASADDVDLGDVIGVGAFGTVRRAVYQRRLVAVKTIAGSADAAHASALLNEARLAAACGPCEHIVAVHAYCPQPACLIMELVDGVSLHELVHGAAPALTWAAVECVALGVARALAHAHSRFIMHRDVKPSNVLVSSVGHVKLCDFGLGRDLRLADPSRPATGGVGTARYMAPEVVMRRPYGTAVDVYSYGMLLWEMAARREPFAGEPARKAAIEAACVDRRPAVPRSTPPRLAALIRACWAPSAGDRPTAPQIVHFIESAPVVPREMRACRVPMSDASCALGETDNDGWLAWTETESECVTVSDSLSHHTSASPTAACSRVSCTSNTSSDALDTDAGGVSTAVRFSS